MLEQLLKQSLWFNKTSKVSMMFLGFLLPQGDKSVLHTTVLRGGAGDNWPGTAHCMCAQTSKTYH